MAVPPKRKDNRSGRRAQSRVTPKGTQPAGGRQPNSWVAAPPRGQCPPWHFYWCDGHEDWHHHTEDVVGAIAHSLTPATPPPGEPSGE